MPARASGRKRDLEGYIDKGEMHWKKFLEMLAEQSSSRVQLFLLKSLHADMIGEDGFIRIETWTEKVGEESLKYKASVKFDKDFVVMVFSERYSQLGWISGVYFSRQRIDWLSDQIQEDHGRHKEKEADAAIEVAAQNLVRAGLFDNVEDAVTFIKSKPAAKPESKTKLKTDKESVAA